MPRTTALIARAVGATAALLLPVAVLASPAAADGPPPGPPGAWQPYRAESFTAPAGTLCAFSLRSEVVLDEEWVRTTTAPDGSLLRQEFVGPLVVRLTDVDTGASVKRSLSARAVAEYAPDGSFVLRIQGPAAVGFHPGDSLPPGYYLLRGRHTVRFAADGTRTVVLDRGPEEDLCATLSP